jgi:hypothetical protein
MESVSSRGLACKCHWSFLRVRALRVTWCCSLEWNVLSPRILTCKISFRQILILLLLYHRLLTALFAVELIFRPLELYEICRH